MDSEDKAVAMREAQALFDHADARVREMAREAGVPDSHFERARAAFARRIRPHAGKGPKPIKESRYRYWWEGYAAALHEVLEPEWPAPPPSTPEEHAHAMAFATAAGKGASAHASALLVHLLEDGAPSIVRVEAVSPNGARAPFAGEYPP